MQGWIVVAYSFVVVARAVVLLFLTNLASWLLLLLYPYPDPFVHLLLLPAMIVVALSISPVRRRMLKWIVGTPPRAVSHTATRTE